MKINVCWKLCYNIIEIILSLFITMLQNVMKSFNLGMVNTLVHLTLINLNASNSSLRAGQNQVVLPE